MNKHESIKLFTQVSGEHPASITAQAAAIALYCLKNNVTLAGLEELAGDRESLQLIIKAATAAHESHNIRPFGEAIVPSVQSTAFIISADVDLARRMMAGLQEEQIRSILNLNPKNSDKEQEYRGVAENMLEF